MIVAGAARSVANASFLCFSSRAVACVLFADSVNYKHATPTPTHFAWGGGGGGGGALACADQRRNRLRELRVRKMQSQRPSSGFVRRTTASEVKQQRPKTSLGFAQKPDVSGRGRQLAGFDVSEYFRRHGSSAGLHIGVNGTPSGDAVIQSYVEDCRLEALVRELEQEEEEDEEAEEREIWRKNNEGSGCGESRIQLQRAPLCWDALLEKTEAKTALGLAKSPSNVIPQVSVRIPYGNEPKPRTRAVYATHGGTSGNMRRPLRMTRQDGIHRNTCPPVDDQSLTPGGVSVAPERRCQCEEIEDEDTTDLRGAQ